MATKLYRAGTTNIVDGIECEIRLFDCRDPLSFIGIDGWCATPQDINKTESVDEFADHSADNIRELAKEAGIDGWEKKRINTLKGELSGQS